MGYIRGFVHGAVIGSVIGICMAPQEGERTRAQLKEAGKGVRTGLQITGRAMQRVAPVVAPVAGNAMQAVERVRHRHASDDGGYTGNGVSVPGAAATPPTG